MKMQIPKLPQVHILKMFYAYHFDSFRICHNDMYNMNDMNRILMNRVVIFGVPGSAPLRLHWQQHAGVLQCRCPWAKNC